MTAMDYRDQIMGLVAVPFGVASVGDMLGKIFRNMQVTSVEDLSLALQEAWAEVPQQKNRKFYRSMSCRVLYVKSGQGGATGY